MKLFVAAGVALGAIVWEADAGTGGRKLTWFDRSGKATGTLGNAGDFRSLEFSPDHKSVAVSVTDGGRQPGSLDLRRRTGTAHPVYLRSSCYAAR